MSDPTDPSGETPEETLARLQGPAAEGDGGSPSPDADDQAGQRFPVVRWREGYDIDAVDAFMRDVGARTADEVRTVQFPIRRRRGYDMDKVDTELDRWEQRLRRPAP